MAWLTSSLAPSKRSKHRVNQTFSSPNSFLRTLDATGAVNIIAAREGFYSAQGPVLVMYPRSEDLGQIVGAHGITALAIVQWEDKLDTWVREVDAEIVHTFEPINSQRQSFQKAPEPELAPKVIERLQRITEAINHNNLVSRSGFEKDVVVEELLQLHDAGFELPPNRIMQRAAAHGWHHDNPKTLGEYAKRISSGVRPRLGH